ncbi:MAG: hypothetical protein H6590_01390 [Flavobacteriales bacterium]|nr:hypothetical protein [Flavobacteriales bacterium]
MFRSPRHTLVLLALMVFVSIKAQRTFDVTIADSTYHMKQYWFVLYSTGADTTALDSTTSAELMKAHLAHQDMQGERGLIVMGGPYGPNDVRWRGLLLYDCETREEVEGYLRQDPLVRRGRLAYTIAPWFGAVGTKLP